MRDRASIDDAQIGGFAALCVTESDAGEGLADEFGFVLVDFATEGDGAEAGSGLGGCRWRHGRSSKPQAVISHAHCLRPVGPAAKRLTPTARWSPTPIPCTRRWRRPCRMRE